MVFLQVNYFVDEASNTGKGYNTTISLVHHFLATHGFGKTSVHFHADNCSDQNKNRFLMNYFMWRILTRDLIQYQIIPFRACSGKKENLYTTIWLILL